MTAAQLAAERGVRMEKGDERMFDEIRRALRKGDGELPGDVRRFLTDARRRMERGLWQRSEAFRRVDFSPFIKRLLAEFEEVEREPGQ